MAQNNDAAPKAPMHTITTRLKEQLEIHALPDHKVARGHNVRFFRALNQLYGGALEASSQSKQSGPP